MDTPTVQHFSLPSWVNSTPVILISQALVNTPIRRNFYLVLNLLSVSNGDNCFAFVLMEWVCASGQTRFTWIKVALIYSCRLGNIAADPQTIRPRGIFASSRFSSMPCTFARRHSESERIVFLSQSYFYSPRRDPSLQNLFDTFVLPASLLFFFPWDQSNFKQTPLIVLELGGWLSQISMD